MDRDVLYIEKAKLIESIVDIKDIDVIKKVRSFIKSSIPCPAVMTVEELRLEVIKATEQLESGKGTGHEDFVKEMKSWL
ncbi:MAG: hypothetical protein LBR26_05440 [Prevotella sp.]|jgi:hypothetical protein|nr:hypothetical protein [Prevotella sp.]